MRYEILLYDGFDELDALGPWEILSGLAQATDGVEAALVSLDGERPVAASHGAVVRAQAQPSPALDVLILPGGGWNDGAPQGARAEAGRDALLAAIRERHAAGTVIASVCTGAMLVAAAGLLEGRPAITHHSAIDDLRAAGAEVIHARVVDAGDVITAGGVTSGLDLALHLVERDHGSAAALAAERELEYERRGTVWRA